MTLLDALPIEARLVAASIRPDDSPLPRALLNERRVDWRALLAQALRENMLLPLRRRWAGLPLPEPARAALADTDRLASVSEFHQRILWGRLEATVGAAVADGLEVLLLKGSALGAFLYDDRLERPMADADLLVRPEAVPRALGALERAGWTVNPRFRDSAFYEEHQHLPGFEDARGTGAILELHTGIIAPRSGVVVDPATLWSRSRAARLAGEPVRVFEPTDQLLHVCIHFGWSHTMQHGAWRTLRDVALLVVRTAPEWDAFVERARAAGAAAACYWTLRLAREVVGAEVPGSVLEALQPDLPEAVRGSLLRHFALVALLGERGCPSHLTHQVAWTMAMQPATAARPWTADALMPAGRTPLPVPLARRWKLHWRRVPLWLRYLRCVVGGLAPRARGRGR